jgi:hypothetical protein
MIENAMINRTHCMCCNKSELEVFYKTPPIPAFQGCVTTAAKEDIAAPQEWALCAHCGTIMLKSYMPLELIYMDAHATSLGGIWDEHHFHFATFVAKYNTGSILEIGGGIGKLADSFRAAGHKEPWMILEANPLPPVRDLENFSIEKGLFDTNYNLKHDTTIVFSHCLEHIVNLSDMIETIAKQLPMNGRCIVSWPQIENWLPQGFPGAINWEHTYYIPIETLIKLHARHGLRLLEHKKFSNHSHFLAFERSQSDQVLWDSTSYQKNRASIEKYWGLIENRVNQLNRLISDAPKPFYLMPASVYSQYLVAFGINTEYVKGVLDNSTYKQNKRLYGTELIVHHPSILEQTGGTVIISGASHTEQMMASLTAIRSDALLLDTFNYGLDK